MYYGDWYGVWLGDWVGDQSGAGGPTYADMSLTASGSGSASLSLAYSSAEVRQKGGRSKKQAERRVRELLERKKEVSTPLAIEPPRPLPVEVVVQPEAPPAELPLVAQDEVSVVQLAVEAGQEATEDDDDAEALAMILALVA